MVITGEVQQTKLGDGGDATCEGRYLGAAGGGLTLLTVWKHPEEGRSDLVTK